MRSLILLALLGFVAVAVAERRAWPIRTITSAGAANVESFCLNTELKPRQKFSAELELVFRASRGQENNVRVVFLHSASAVEYETRLCARDERCEEGERKALVKLVENGASDVQRFSQLDVMSLLAGKLAGAVESGAGLRSAILYVESVEFSQVEGFTATCTAPHITAPTTVTSVTSVTVSGNKVHPTTGPAQHGSIDDEDARRSQFKADWMSRRKHATEEQWEKFEQNMQQHSGAEISGHNRKHENKDHKHENKDHKHENKEQNHENKDQKDQKDQKHEANKPEHGKKDYENRHHQGNAESESGLTLSIVLPIAGGVSLAIFLIFLVGVCLCSNRRCKKGCKACPTEASKKLLEDDSTPVNEPVQYVSGGAVELGQMLGDAQV